MISAPKSGSGKTTLTCAILQLLKNHGKRPVAFKCGPDFIDPMFHKQVLGIHSTNLDSFFVDEEEVRQIFSENMETEDDSLPTENNQPEKIAVIEGVMGLFDGLGGTSLKASSYDIARITKTPILLVIDAEGASRSIVPLVKGFLDYDKAHSGTDENLIKGIFLNKVSKGTFQLLKSLIEEETASEYGVKVIGYLQKDSKDVWKSRHLGLLLPDEIKNLKEQIQNTARTLENTLDFEALEKISNGALRVGSDGETSPFVIKTSTNSAFRIPHSELTLAVALDEAFCFYYHENMRILEKSGAKLVYFSPLHDKSLPNGVNGLLIGGGYPELYASPLQANESMRKSIKSAVDGGLPVMAECGGFMYLQEKIITETGESYEMCGAIKGECRYTGKLVRFGYADFVLKGGACENTGSENHCLPRNFSIKGHEFHYFDSTNNGADFTASKPLSKKSWDCMIFTPTMLAGFPHLYYSSSPEIVRWFLETALTRTKPHIY
jgi:cobyrinic acid a,c-diamide synthase